MYAPECGPDFALGLLTGLVSDALLEHVCGRTHARASHDIVDDRFVVCAGWSRASSKLGLSL